MTTPQILASLAALRLPAPPVSVLGPPPAALAALPAPTMPNVSPAPPSGGIPSLLQPNAPPNTSSLGPTPVPSPALPTPSPSLLRIAAPDPTSLQRLPIPDLTGGNSPLSGPSALAAPTMPKVQGPPSQIGIDQNRLNFLRNSGSGISQIGQNVDPTTGVKTPGHLGFWGGLGKVGATVGDDILRIAAPKLEQMIPGGVGQNDYLQGRQQNFLGNDLATAQSEATTQNLNLQPQLKLMAAENLHDKTQGYLQHISDQQQNYQDKNLANLREHGLTYDEADPTGTKLRPLKYEEMTPLQQGKYDIDQSQQELQDAESAYKKAQATNIPINIQLAEGRLSVARKNANTAVQRLTSRPVQVIDPNDPDNTVYETAGQAMATGAHGTGGLGFSTKKMLQRDFTSGKDSHTLNSFNTAEEHLQQLQTAADALNNGNLPMLNQAGNAYAAATGSAAPTNFAAVKNAVAGEVGKTFQGGAVTEGERGALDAAINGASSPAQLNGVIQQYRQLMQSKRSALQQQYQQGMQGKPAFNIPTTGSPKEGDTKVNSAGDKVSFRDGKWGPA